MSVTTQIVTVDAIVTPAPQPATLQQKGTLVSVGGTTLTTNAYQYCGNVEAVQALLSGSGNSVEVGNMATSFFAQGSAIGVYVLELGSQGSASLAIAALENWINANPNTLYGFLNPATWDSVGSTVNTMSSNYSSPTGKTYFFQMTTAGTISAYQSTNKALFTVVPSSTAGGSEFAAAGPFYDWLVNQPSPASPAAPMGYRFEFGLTPWPLVGNQATLNSILSQNGNIIIAGSEGGISNAILEHGTTVDGNQAMFWYAVDYIQIQAKLQLANAIINAANSGTPIYYNQFGINSLLAILTSIGRSAISSGLLLSGTFDAVPFTTYVAQNPGDYPAGVYNGFSATVTPQNSFTSIEFFLDATQFAA